MRYSYFCVILSLFTLLLFIVILFSVIFVLEYMRYSTIRLFENISYNLSLYYIKCINSVFNMFTRGIILLLFIVFLFIIVYTCLYIFIHLYTSV